MSESIARDLVMSRCVVNRSANVSVHIQRGTWGQVTLLSSSLVSSSSSSFSAHNVVNVPSVSTFQSLYSSCLGKLLSVVKLVQVCDGSLRDRDRVHCWILGDVRAPSADGPVEDSLWATFSLWRERHSERLVFAVSVFSFFLQHKQGHCYHYGFDLPCQAYKHAFLANV